MPGGGGAGGKAPLNCAAGSAGHDPSSYLDEGTAGGTGCSTETCTVTQKCVAGYVCRFDQGCAMPGHCVAEPAECSGAGSGGAPSWSPPSCVAATTDPCGQVTCGCDGRLYRTFCSAVAVGAGVDDANGCSATCDTYACGSRWCRRDVEYCDQVGAAGAMECHGKPSACSTAVDPCACLLANVPNATSCSVDADGQATVVTSM